MSFEPRPVNDLIKLASAGGGFYLDAAARPTNDLILIAKAASNGGARVYFRGMAPRPINDLILIGAAGKGAVVFEG